MDTKICELRKKELRDEIERPYHRIKNIEFHHDHVSYEKDYKKSYMGIVGISTILFGMILFFFGIVFGMIIVFGMVN